MTNYPCMHCKHYVLAFASVTAVSSSNAILTAFINTFS